MQSQANTNKQQQVDPKATQQQQQKQTQQTQQQQQQKADVSKQQPQVSPQKSPANNNISAPQKDPLKDLIKKRVEKQTAVLNRYPDIPLIEEVIIKTFDELAFKMSDQQDYLMQKLEEIRSVFEQSSMVQMNKRLQLENKDLKARMESKMTTKMQNLIKEEQEKEKDRLDQERIDQIARLREENKSMNTQLYDKDEEIYQLQQKLLGAQKVQKDLDNEIKRLKTNDESQTSQIKQLQLDKDSSLKQINTLLQENKKLNDQVIQFEKNQSSQQVQDKNKISETSTKLVDLETKLKDKDQAIKDKDQAIKDKDLAIKDKDQIIKEKDQTLKEKEVTMTQLKNQIELCNSIIQSQENEIKKSQSEYNDAKLINNQMLLQIQSDEKLIFAHSESLKKYDLIKQQLEAENKNLKQKVNELEQDIQNINGSNPNNDEGNNHNISKINQDQTLNQSYLSPRMSLSPSPDANKRNGKQVDEQERQLLADMNFSMDLLNSVKASNQGSRIQSQKRSQSSNHTAMKQKDLSNSRLGNKQDEFVTFAQIRSTKSIQYLTQELQQIKEQIYSKLRFLLIKVIASKEDQPEDIYGIFKNSQEDLGQFIKDEINHLQQISNVINEVILQSEDSFSKVHEEKISSKLRQIISEDNQNGDSKLEDIIQRLNELFDSLRDENIAYKAQVEQNYEPKIQQLIQENKSLRDGHSLQKYDSVSILQKFILFQILIENDMLKQEILKIKQQHNEIMKIENQNNQSQQILIAQMTQENESLLEKAQRLSENLRELARELEFMRESKERLERENLYLNKKSEQLSQDYKNLSKNTAAPISPNNKEQDQTNLPNELRKSSVSMQSFGTTNNQNPYRRSQPFTKYLNEKQSQQQSEQKNIYQLPGRYSNVNPDESLKKKQIETDKLNQLINEYKRENTKCTQKITELKDKLQNTKYKQAFNIHLYRFYIDRNNMRDSFNNTNGNESNYSNSPSKSVLSSNKKSSSNGFSQGKSSQYGRGFSQPTVNERITDGRYS
ncbi:UNKNOWN [Stylonychia lemnae]|uniref:Uncharacterized protein n=1 Tax=Stylonychia lemnae TaxID=5949 RepID=A0A078ALD0_STYLE|nr:UNKNOWN [Stylonychia lemnae]|eukprot:CDW82217.1 UNKNOWN [Stylonychia lemnae]